MYKMKPNQLPKPSFKSKVNAFIVLETNEVCSGDNSLVLESNALKSLVRTSATCTITHENE